MLHFRVVPEQAPGLFPNAGVKSTRSNVLETAVVCDHQHLHEHYLVLADDLLGVNAGGAADATPYGCASLEVVTQHLKPEWEWGCWSARCCVVAFYCVGRG